MANNMTIGPALSIGGNTVEMTTNGKVQVTNTRGEVKTLSQAHRNYVFSDAVDTINLDVKTREQLKKDAEKAFEKDAEELIPHKYVKRDKQGNPIGIMNKTERKAFDKAQKKLAEAKPETPKTK